jgi:hypothetical protein
MTSFQIERLDKLLRKKIFIVSYIVVIFSAPFFYNTALFMRGGNPYLQGDWLINYQMGFVRRGMLGEILLRIADTTGFNLLFMVYFAQTSVFFLFMILVLRETYNRYRSRFLLLVLMNPLFLLFYFSDPQGSFRKEGVTFLLILLIHTSIRLQKKLFMIALSILVSINVFSFDAQIFISPLIVYSFVAAQRSGLISRKTLYLLQTFYAGVASTALLFFAIRPASISQVEGICRSLYARGVPSDICFDGASIAAIAETPTSAILSSGILAWESATTLTFLILGTVALFPIIRYQLQLSRSYILLVLFSMVTQCFLVSDFGRWLSIAFFSLLIASFFPYAKKDELNKLVKNRFFYMFCILFFVFRIPHFAGFLEPWQISSVFSGLIRYPLGLLGIFEIS